MADDIVDRLRDSANWTGPLKLEAADEIERLRAKIERWRETLTMVHGWLDRMREQYEEH